MAYLLYGANGSGSSIVEAVLAEIGADYEVRAVDAANGAHRHDAYAAVNPHRKLPTLITPEGQTLTESAAIVLSLDERHPRAAVLPPPASAARAQALRWLLFAASELYPVVEIMDHPERFTTEDSAVQGVRRRAHQTWRQRWTVVESALTTGPYLIGAQCSATDIYLAALSRWDLPDGWRATNIPKVERLAAAVKARPKLGAVWARHFPSV